MKILGISSGITGHNSSASLVIDGKLIVSAEEERFNRIKYFGGFPEKAAKFCLEYANLSINQIDHIAVPWDASFSKMKSSVFTKLRHSKNKISPQYMFNLAVALPNLFRDKENNTSIIRNNLNSGNIEITPIEHHLCHAATAFYPSGFKESSVITVDGCGENNSTVSWYGNNHNIKKIRQEGLRNSLGFIYESISDYLGLGLLEGAGKTMGLASYGNSNPRIKEAMKKLLDPEKGQWYYAKYTLENQDILPKILGAPRVKDTKILIDKNKPYRDIAFQLQHNTEQALLNTVRDTIKTLDNENLCLSGGVALNCVANGKILQSGLINDIFIFPAANDGGASAGAALEIASVSGDKVNFKMENAYYGPEFSNNEIRKILDERKIKYSMEKNICKAASELIAKGNVVGWFQGRMEMGSRALGNRSILADPRNPKMKDIVNLKVKKREWWRPFCPSILDKAKNEYLINPHDSPFMILAFEVPKEKHKEIPSVVHVDGTARPQTVKKSANPKYYKLIKNLEKETGVPVVLNTSFNIRGEPIVCRPEDAIKTFYNTGMDYLVLGNYLIKKPDK